MVYPNTTDQKKPKDLPPLSMPAMHGGQTKYAFFFQQGHGFAKAGHRSVGIQKNQGGAINMYTSVFLVVNGQDPTPGFDRFHRHQFLPSKFLELELETPPSGKPEGIL